MREVWKLEALTTSQPRSEYDYLLDLPLWSSVPNMGMLFDISPREVILNPEKSPHQTERIQKTDIGYPLDFLVMDGRHWILDGVHRLAKIYQLGVEFIKIRVHAESVIPQIKRIAKDDAHGMRIVGCNPSLSKG
ncbi:MAG: hypothetical protein V4819_15995 [Verrucomicrobiota bacterium]